VNSFSLSSGQLFRTLFFSPHRPHVLLPYSFLPIDAYVLAAAKLLSFALVLLFPPPPRRF